MRANSTRKCLNCALQHIRTMLGSIARAGLRASAAVAPRQALAAGRYLRCSAVCPASSSSFHSSSSRSAGLPQVTCAALNHVGVHQAAGTWKSCEMCRCLHVLTLLLPCCTLTVAWNNDTLRAKRRQGCYDWRWPGVTRQHGRKRQCNKGKQT
jgi:hypothetical protein